MSIVTLVFLGFIFIFLPSVRIVSQWQKGIVLRFGKVVRELGAGFNFVLPYIDSVRKVDMRIRTMDVQPQEVMTKDSVPVKVDAVVYFQIFDATKSLVEVEDFWMASTLLAQSKLRDAVGKYDMDYLLSNKEGLCKEILNSLQEPTDVWGVKITAVEIKNIELPENMKRAMAKESEAMREKRARLIKASAEKEASEMLTEASKKLGESPNSLILRQLQTWQEIGAEQNSLIILVPTEFATMLKK